MSRHTIMLFWSTLHLIHQIRRKYRKRPDLSDRIVGVVMDAWAKTGSLPWFSRHVMINAALAVAESTAWLSSQKTRPTSEAEFDEADVIRINMKDGLRNPSTFEKRCGAVIGSPEATKILRDTVGRWEASEECRDHMRSIKAKFGLT